MTASAQEVRAGSDLAVATHGLTKRYGPRTALDRVDLRVPEGSVYALVGANGAGKSTAFKLLMNLERPDEGTAQIFGLDAGARGGGARMQIGYVPERHDGGFSWMTCGRLLRHVAAYYPSWDSGYADRLGDELALQPGRKVHTLSKGEARRLQFVMALAHRPPVLLLDEPTDGFDTVVRNRALSLLAEHLADTPTTTVLSTHHLGEVESLVDHVGVLREGRLVAQLSRDELRRTVRRYRVEIPDGWEAPQDMHVLRARRSSTGRETQLTFSGEAHDVAERIARAGATVRESVVLSLEDAALALLPEEIAP